MKKGFAVLLSFSLILFCAASTALAEKEASTYDWRAKLKRGAVNVLTFPVELKDEFDKRLDNEGLMRACSEGAAKGVGLSVTRAFAGAVDILTCPFNYPREDKGPLVQPEYAWQKTE